MQKNKRKQFERNVKKILKYIDSTGELPNPIDEETAEYLYYCISEKNYVTGVVAQRMIAQNVVFDLSRDRLFLTKEGLDFIWKPIPWEFGANILLAVITAISVVVAIVQSLN